MKNIQYQTLRTRENVFIMLLKEGFEDTKGVTESVNRRWTDNTMAKSKRTKGHKTIYKTYT